MSLRKKAIIAVGAFAAVILLALWLFPPYAIINRFRAQQTVDEAIQQIENSSDIRAELSALNIDTLDFRLALVAIKSDRILEVHARNVNEQDWKYVKTFPFTEFSGTLGPKLKEGDRQIPEGIYRVEFLNPNSAYHLSLRVNYPNEFDKKMASSDGRTNLGGDIMIHGKAVTVGCIPIGDAAIEEVFLLASTAYNYEIPVIISPVDFRKKVEAPSINVDWSAELYESLEQALEPFEPQMN